MVLWTNCSHLQLHNFHLRFTDGSRDVAPDGWYSMKGGHLDWARTGRVQDLLCRQSTLRMTIDLDTVTIARRHPGIPPRSFPSTKHFPFLAIHVRVPSYPHRREPGELLYLRAGAET